MLRAVTLSAVAFAAACYRDPSLASCKYRCGGATNQSCPNGFDCLSGFCVTNGDTCTGDGGVIDGAVAEDAALADAPLDTPSCAAITFNTVALAVGATPRSLVAFDVDGNTFPDLVVVDGTATSNAAGVFLNMNGSGFDSRMALSNTSGAVTVARADVDDDGARDDVFILRGYMPGTGVVHSTNSGGGGFATVPWSVSGTEDPGDFAVEDVDGDGDEEYGVRYVGSSSIKFLDHQETGFAVGPTFPVDSSPTTFTLAKINSGTTMDVAVVYKAADKFMFYSGTGPFAFASGVDQAVGDGPVDIAVGQLLSGGGRSVVTANSLGDSVSIRHNTGTASFSSGGDPATGDEPVAVILADMNNDLLIDIVTANRSGSTISILLNQGSGFAAHQEFIAGSVPIDLVAADFNKDGRMDVAVADAASDTVSIMFQGCM